jgi:hypothetical protein
MSPCLKAGGSWVHNAVSRSVNCLGLNTALIRFSGRPILPLASNGGWLTAGPLTGLICAQCRPQDRSQTWPDRSGFFRIELSISAPQEQRCLRSERVSFVLLKLILDATGSFSLAAQERYEFPDTMKHLFLCQNYSIQRHTIQAIPGWLFIPTARSRGLSSHYFGKNLPQPVE